MCQLAPPTPRLTSLPPPLPSATPGLSAVCVGGGDPQRNGASRPRAAGLGGGCCEGATRCRKSAGTSTARTQGALVCPGAGSLPLIANWRGIGASQKGGLGEAGGGGGWRPGGAGGEPGKPGSDKLGGRVVARRLSLGRGGERMCPLPGDQHLRAPRNPLAPLGGLQGVGGGARAASTLDIGRRRSGVPRSRAQKVPPGTPPLTHTHTTTGSLSLGCARYRVPQ